MTTATSSTCDFATEKGCECQTRTGEPGIAKNTSTRSRRLQEVIFSTTAPMQPSSGSSTGFTEVSRASSSRDGLLTSVSASGAELRSCPSRSTSLEGASASASTTATLMTTSTSATE